MLRNMFYIRNLKVNCKKEYPEVKYADGNMNHAIKTNSKVNLPNGCFNKKSNYLYIEKYGNKMTNTSAKDKQMPNAMIKWEFRPNIKNNTSSIKKASCH